MGMGFSGLTVIFASGVALLASQSARADQVIFERLERGETIATTAGTAATLQMVVKKNASDISDVIFKDPQKLSKIFPNIAFARTYKTSDGKNLLYLKLRGLGDGLGVLMEVKEGGEEAFDNAIALTTSSAALGLRETGAEVNLKKDVQNQTVLEASQAGNLSVQRKITPFKNKTTYKDVNIVLEGPLNEVLEMPSLRLTMNLGLYEYDVSSAGATSNYSYIVSKISIGNQVPRGELGDYRGFGDQRLQMTKMMGTDLFAVLKNRLENL